MPNGMVSAARCGWRCDPRDAGRWPRTLYSLVQAAQATGNVPSVSTDAGNRDSAVARHLKAELKHVTEERDIPRK